MRACVGLLEHSYRAGHHDWGSQSMTTGADVRALPDMGGNTDLSNMQRQIAHVMEENQLLVKTVRGHLPSATCRCYWKMLLLECRP